MVTLFTSGGAHHFSTCFQRTHGSLFILSSMQVYRGGYSPQDRHAVEAGLHRCVCVCVIVCVCLHVVCTCVSWGGGLTLG